MTDHDYEEVDMTDFAPNLDALAGIEAQIADLTKAADAIREEELRILIDRWGGKTYGARAVIGVNDKGHPRDGKSFSYTGKDDALDEISPWYVKAMRQKWIDAHQTLGRIEFAVPEELRGKLTIDVPTAARVLGISRRAGYDAVNRGEIQALTFGARVVVPVLPLLKQLGFDVREDAPKPSPEAGQEPVILSVARQMEFDMARKRDKDRRKLEKQNGA